MKIALVAIALRLTSDVQSAKITDPGRVRHIAWIPRGNLVAVAGRPEFEEKLYAFVEVSATPAPVRNRAFIVLGGTDAVEPHEGHALEYVGSATSQHSARVAHVYEIVKLPTDN